MKPHKSNKYKIVPGGHPVGIIHKHDWHCGGISNHMDEDLVTEQPIRVYTSSWACSICGAVKELKSKEVVK